MSFFSPFWEKCAWVLYQYEKCKTVKIGIFDAFWEMVFSFNGMVTRIY
jgi:hypothetical protein